MAGRGIRAIPAVVAVLLCAALAWGGIAGCASQKKKKKPEKKGPYATLATSRGPIVVRLLPEEAPKTVRNFIALARGEKEWTDPATKRKTKRPLYAGTEFFRVIPEFMIQGGCPRGDGSGGPGYSFEDEIFIGRGFSEPGMVAMANSGPDANGSQFFITLNPVPFLDKKHTIFGEVVDGIEVAVAISTSPRIEFDPGTGRQVDRPVEPPVLESVRIEAEWEGDAADR